MVEQVTGSFTMTYDGKTYTYPAERLWEIIARADAKFCQPMQPEDHARFARALAKGKKK